jgi:soluble cytochrome b562
MPHRIFVLVAVACAVLATPAYAVIPDEDSAVSKNFKSIGRDMRSVGRISDLPEMIATLEKFHAAVSANREEVPSFMEPDTEMYTDFQNGIDEFIAEIEKALALAKGGDLAGAQDVAGGFRDFRRKYHEHFNIEDD